MRHVRFMLLVLALATSGAGAAERGPAGPFIGQPLDQVLRAYRDAGLPLAWSSSLVPAGLPVTTEPSGERPAAAIREMLAPHDLSLLERDGVLLVVRAAGPEPPAAPAGALLVMVRELDASVPGAPVTLTARPALPTAEDLGAGVFQFRAAAPGLYEIGISAPGYQPVLRQAHIQHGGLATLSVRLQPGPAELETLTVSTSRYVLQSNSQFFIDQRAIQNLPDIGDDPIRSVHRLPGSAAGGWSARSHFRGGEENETSIFLNGLQLLDPFHVRDFHNVFSSIDARTIAGVEAYTGGFPALYGDRMSGILLLRSQRPEKPRRHELGVSVFNTSALTSGYSESGRVDWLFSARRSNLEWVLDKRDHGEPSYHDIFAEVGIQFSDHTHVTFNAQRAEDGVLVITENNPEEQEFARSDTLNENYWVHVENQWSERLLSGTVLSWSEFSNQRDAVANDPEQLVGKVFDRRDIQVLGLRQDWSLDTSSRHRLKWGLDFKRQQARYRYISRARYFGAYLLFPGIPQRRTRDITARPEGTGLGLYLADRFQLTPRTTLEAGLRWDRQTWQGPASGSQVSPRISILHEVGETTDLRLTWGEYHQSQGIHELQVEDGLDRFQPAQESRHLIAGMSHRWQGGASLRLELYDKDYTRLRPRFENLLDPLPLIPEFEVDRIRVAPDSAASRGLEMTLEKQHGPDLNWWASYGWSRVRDRIDGRHEARNWDQRHSFQAGLAWQRGPWEMGAALKLHSGWPTTAARLLEGEDEEPAIVFGARNRLELNTFINLDVRIARVWALPESKLTAFLEISNLSNRENQCCVDYDVEFEDEEEEGDAELERSVDHWLGLTPAIGLLWEF